MKKPKRVAPAKSDPILEAIERFRKLESDNDGAALLDDPLLVKLVSAWSTIPVRRDLEVVNPPDSWSSLWLSFEVDPHDIATALDVPLEKAQAKLSQAVAIRIVYPDGTTNASARSIVSAKILDALNAKPTRRG